jgi:hypothetical protein
MNSIITIMRQGQIVLSVSVDICATEFIEKSFLQLLNGNTPKGTPDQSIQEFMRMLMLQHPVKFVQVEDNHVGDYLYLIHFEYNEVNFSMQHPTSSVDGLTFLKFRTWAVEPSAINITSMN